MSKDCCYLGYDGLFASSIPSILQYQVGGTNKEQLYLIIQAYGLDLYVVVAYPTKVRMEAFWGKASMKVTILRVVCNLLCKECFLDSRSLELERKVGGKVCPKLNIGLTPIVNKYPE